ncbi:MAG TPA: 30S ribosomal protein S4e [Candidatus Nanoarchaeia archaeon]|nr:30S ribosomal protein S4e [Candidatus Nanoarchaeia archaeon]
MKMHLKRLAAPKSWRLNRKEHRLIVRPNPGAHKFSHSISLNTFLKSMINTASTTREVKYILKNKTVLVDGRKRREHKFSVGLMDVVSIPEIKENYRMIIDRNGKIAARKINGEEVNFKMCRIEDKRFAKGKMHLNLGGGRNIIVDNNDYKTGDSVALSIPEQKILNHIRLESGAIALMTGGKHVGEICTVERVESDKVVLKSQEGKFDARKKDVFAIGKEKPLINIQ